MKVVRTPAATRVQEDILPGMNRSPTPPVESDQFPSFDFGQWSNRDISSFLHTIHQSAPDSGRKQEHSFDFDAEQNADDERQPLIPGSVRTVRHTRHSRHYDDEDNPYRHDDYLFAQTQTKRCCGTNRITACLLSFVVVVFVLASILRLFRLVAVGCINEITS